MSVETNQRTLRRGDTGSDVVDLQVALNRQDFGYGYVEEDGVFGAETEQAVISFQLYHELEPDGIVGPDTWSFL